MINNDELQEDLESLFDMMNKQNASRCGITTEMRICDYIEARNLAKKIVKERKRL